jgi:threonine dehydratase
MAFLCTVDPYFSPFLTPSVLAERYQLLAPKLHRTPVLTSSSLDALSGASLFFKCENFQRSGAFKMRGVQNALLELERAGLPAAGVVTHSSGNHGQALGWACAEKGLPCTVVMPSNAPDFKKRAVALTGAHIVECTPTLSARIEAVEAVQRETGAVEIHPSNQAPVILGQGSAAWELLEDCAAQGQPLDWVGVPVGGGGLLAGTAFAVHVWNQKHGTSVRVYAGEPTGADDAFRSLASGQIEHNENPQTVADGMRTELGHINFPVIKAHVTAIHTVTDPEILSGQLLLAERLKIIVETNCSPPFAAVLKHPEVFTGHRVGVVLSGGNLDLQAHRWGA